MEDRVHVRRRALAHDHVLGDLLAHHRERLDLDAIAFAVRGDSGLEALGFRLWALGSRLRGFGPWGLGFWLWALGFRLRRLEELEDVVFGYASAETRALDQRDVNVVFLRDPANERRRLLPAHIVVAQCGGHFAAVRFLSRAAFLLGRPGAVSLDLHVNGARLLRRRRRGLLGWPIRRGHFGGFANRRNHLVHRDRLACLDLDLGQDAGRGRGNLSVYFVGRDFEQRLVAIDRIAHLLDPADDRPLGNRFPHLGHHDWCSHMSFEPFGSFGTVRLVLHVYG